MEQEGKRGEMGRSDTSLSTGFPRKGCFKQLVSDEPSLGQESKVFFDEVVVEVVQ